MEKIGVSADYGGGLAEGSMAHRKNRALRFVAGRQDNGRFTQRRKDAEDDSKAVEANAFGTSSNGDPAWHLFLSRLGVFAQAPTSQSPAAGRHSPGTLL